MDFIKTLAARSRPESLMLDIGANVGGYTHTLLQHKGIIHAFEPCPVLAEGIAKRFKDEPRVTVFRNGVSDRIYRENGLTVFEAWTLGKAGAPNKRGLSLGALEMVGNDPFSVDFTTVDDHMRSSHVPANMPVDFMKIDTDGHDLRVLKGAENTILQWRPNILIELGYLIDDVGDSIEEYVNFIHSGLGYCLYAQSGELLPFQTWKNWYPFNTTFDVAMIPLGRPLDPQ